MAPESSGCARRSSRTGWRSTPRGADGLTYARWQRRATPVGQALRGAACAGAPGSGPPPDFDGRTATVADLDTGGTGRLEAGVGPDDIADIPFTSGTTGPAKAFTNPHGHLVYGKARWPWLPCVLVRRDHQHRS
ncbi:hypothetical protein [Streptomyces sp. NPDC058451]|uniref:hypothetical protein n=1 Tax=Streptomyces sp. NPDC058451 TaxID=3346506 RepID=UPI0036615B21